MNVLSLFDWMSCGQLACGKAGMRIEQYIASEIKTTAIKTTQKHFPNTKQLGDVRGVSWFGLPRIDLFFSGNPCKGISKMNQNQEGLNHKESILFWDAVRIFKDLQKINPKIKFVFENVHGNKEATSAISESLGVNPISINSSLFTSQNRPRYYWTNIEGVTVPKDKGLVALHIPGPAVQSNRVKWITNDSGRKSIKKGYTKINPFPKYGCITANGHKKWNENYLLIEGKYYHVAQVELEKMQSIPIGYTSHLSYAEAYDLIGDGWTVDVIAHILSFMK